MCHITSYTLLYNIDKHHNYNTIFYIKICCTTESLLSYNPYIAKAMMTFKIIMIPILYCLIYNSGGLSRYSGYWTSSPYIAV